MCHKFVRVNSRAVARLFAAGLIAAVLAGCSSDANRLTNPFGNPFSSQPDIGPTGSIPSKARTVAQSAVVARPLPSVASAPLSVPAKAATLRPQISASPAYNTPQVSAGDVTSSISRPVATSARAGGWAAEGGTPIVAAQGETSAMLARRYGVPEDALLRVNGFSAASQVQPGSRLIVPVYNGAARQTAATAETVRAPKVASVAADPKPATGKVANTNVRQKPTVLAKAAPADDAADEADVVVKPAPAAKPVPAKAKLAAKAPVVPVKAAQVTKPEKAKVAVAVKPVPEPKVVAAAKKPEAVKIAKVEKPTIEAKKPEVDRTPVATLPPPSTPAPAVAESANPEFRWPARGRIIQGFKSGGNDGINIAVPEGTSVKAAEGGVVAYAGSELKGYGNLVLIRHPNGFVSAYANNGDIEVKRGDSVKRGQTIAKSGQSGNVSSPQLHFELRKGSTPVDPTNYLAGL